MAVLDGVLMGVPESPSVGNPNLSADGYTVDGIHKPYPMSDSPAAVAGAYTYTANVNVPAKRALSAVRVGSMMDDFYYRVHVIPPVINLGNLLSVQTRTADVWNAWLTAQTLTAIDELATEGITESGLAPGQFEPMEVKTLTLEVDTSGPAFVGALYTFQFDLEAPTLQIIGRRVVIFAHAPNWADPIIESHEWLTDIFESYSGAEQRVGLRGKPRRGLAYTVTTEDQHQSNRLETKLLGWQQNLFAVPVWTDVQELSAPLGLGAVSVPCATSGYEFATDNLAMLWRGYDQNEAVEILSVDGAGINLKLPTVAAWGVGTRLYPMRLARLPARQKITRFTGLISSGRFEFAMDDNPGFAAADAGATYQGYRVLEIAPNWASDLDVEFVRKLATLDYGTGKSWSLDESGLANMLKNYHWLLNGRAAITAFRSWLYAREGALVPFWSESQGDDLTVINDITSGVTAITVRNIGYSSLIKSQTHRRDIAIHATSGAVYYRRITDASEIDDNSESIVIDTSLGVTLAVADIAAVRFLHLHRLESDRAEIEWAAPYQAESSLMLRSLPT